MDTMVLREIFGSDVAIFIYGIFAGYKLALHFIVPIKIAQIEKNIPTETFSRSCRLIECAYGGYRHEVKISVKGDKIINCKCPNFDWSSHKCLDSGEFCPLFNRGKLF